MSKISELSTSDVCIFYKELFSHSNPMHKEQLKWTIRNNTLCVMNRHMYECWRGTNILFAIFVLLIKI